MSERSDPTFFITGAYGYLGQYIVQAIAEAYPRSQLRALVRTPRPLHVPKSAFEGVKIVRGELTEPQSYFEALTGAQVVIHNAALVSFRKSDRQALIEANLTGTQRLAQAAVQAGVRDFIYVSSISAIGSRPGQLSDESMYPEQRKLDEDGYAYSKLMGEYEVLKHHPGLRVVIVNPSVIIGPGSQRIDGLTRLLRFSPLIPSLRTLNSFADVRDVAQAVVLALKAGRSGERYIVSSDNVDMVTFTQAALRAANQRALVVPVTGGWLRIGDALVALLDALKINPGLKKISDLNIDKAYSNQKIRQELGWQPAYSLEQSLHDTLQSSTGAQQ
jgi:dihydroflavonol-4-reductase